MISFRDLAIQDLEEIDPQSKQDLIDHMLELKATIGQDEESDFYERSFWIFVVYTELTIHSSKE